VPKVAKTGAGAMLLKDISQAEAVVRAMVNAVKIPVTVKVRSGWDIWETTAINFAQRAQDAGASAIAVHARFASQGFNGTADWSVIRRVRTWSQFPYSETETWKRHRMPCGWSKKLVVTA